MSLLKHIPTILILLPAVAMDYQNPLLTLEMPVPAAWNSVGGCGGNIERYSNRFHRDDFIELLEHPTYDLPRSFGGTITHALRLQSSHGELILELSPEATLGSFYFRFTKPIVMQYQEEKPSSNHPETGTNSLRIEYSAEKFQLPLFLAVDVADKSGSYASTRGTEQKKEFLPVGLQSSRGVYDFAVRLKARYPTGKGMVSVAATYRNPFNLSMSGENEFMDSYFQSCKSYKDSADSPERKRFYYHFKPYGESDLGDYYPPEAVLTGMFRLPHNKFLSSTWKTEFAVPLGIGWRRNPNVSKYDPHPNPDHRAWRSVFQYALGITKPPVAGVLAISFPLYDSTPDGTDALMKEELAAWSAPDWSDFMQEWAVGLVVHSDLGMVRRVAGGR